MKLSQIDLDSCRKEAIVKCKCCLYILREVREGLIGRYGGVGFYDTKPAHFCILENLCYGVIY